jgi:hypothetical protein
MIDWSVAWKGTKLIDRIEWAKANLKRHDTEYCVVYEDIDMDTVCVMHPDPHCMAMLMHGNLMPPAWVKLKLKEDAERPDFTCHSDFNGHLLHETEPMGSLTEEQAVEYLIQTDIPKHIWENWNSGNKPKMVICRKEQLPQRREWRNAWHISDELAA